MKRILIIEDDPDLQELLENFLRDSGYYTESVYDGISGYEKFTASEFDLILLDIMLPKVDGYGVCELIRKQSNIPIIMITALDSEENQLKGFNLEIDDYITKPFSIPIMLQKIAAVLRRTSSNAPDKILVYRDLVLKPEEYCISVADKNVDLTPREFEVLMEFLQNQGKVLTRKMLLNTLWKYDFYGDERVVDTHIKNVRKKINRDYIETIRGVGYKLVKEN